MLAEMIFAGESENVEFKEDIPAKSEKYMKSVVAFANGTGGKLIFGVQDKTLEIKGFYKDEIFKILAENGITGKNHIAVVYQKEYPYRAIIDDPEFIPCAKILPGQKATQIWFRGSCRSLMMIPNKERIPLYQKELEYLKNMLQNNDHDTYEQLKEFLKNSKLKDMIDWYFAASFDSETDMEAAKKMIEKVFSSYTEFRAWYIARTKQKNKERPKTSSYVSPPSQTQTKSTNISTNKNHTPPSHLETFFAYSFPENNDTKEEFLSPEELADMYSDRVEESHEIAVTGVPKQKVRKTIY